MSIKKILKKHKESAQPHDSLNRNIESNLSPNMWIYFTILYSGFDMF